MKAFLLTAFMFLCLRTEAAVLTVSVFTTDASCGVANGTITSVAQGGTPPYTYLWSTGDVLSTITSLLPGTYTVTVTDAVGAQASATATIINNQTLQNASFTYIIPGQPSWGQNVTLPCNYQCNGIAYLTENVMSGTPPYMLNIGLSTNPNLITTVAGGVAAISNICASDLFTVLVSDMNGCSASVIMSPVGPQPSFNHQTQIKGACFGMNNGSATFSFSELYTQGLIIHYTGPVSDSATLNNPFTVSNLLPGTYFFNIAYPQIVACDTTIVVVVPDLGTNCGSISGSVYLDTISNCVADGGEPQVPQQVIRFDPGPFFSTSDSLGNFHAELPYNTYSATLLSQLPLHPVCNVNGLVLSSTNDTIANVMLGDSVDTGAAIHTGLVNMAFRPGFIGTLYATVFNDSYNSIANPQLDIYFDPLLTFQSSTLTPVLNSPGHLSFNLSAINPFSYASFPVSFQVPANPLLIGTNLSFIATANANVLEADTSDNTDTLLVMVTGSYDPNDKSVSPSRDPLNTFYTDLDEEFEYRIRFQNTGNDTAFTVVVVDTLSLALDPSTIRIIAASHPMQWELSGQNVLKFRFNNILLPDSTTNEPASHGAITFKINPYLPITVSSIENRADIYFDFNPPVLTNVVSSFITVSVGVNEIKQEKELWLIPNPASDILKIQLKKSEFHPETITLTNVLGQTIIRTIADFTSGVENLDVSRLPEGVYFLNVYNRKGDSTSKRLIVRH